MASILPFTQLFPSSPSPLRLAAAKPPAAPAPAAAAPVTVPAAPVTTPAQAAAATQTANIQNENKGVMGLVHTSLTGLNNFLKNLPSRKNLLGE